VRRLPVSFALLVVANAQPLGRPPLLRDVGIDQQLNAQLPLTATFTDDTGHLVRLGDYFGARPVVLAFVYYQCPMLCNQVLTGLLHSLKKISLNAGEQYNVVAISIDPRETVAMAAAKKHTFVQNYGRAEASGGWHFLTGTESAVRKTANVAGFHYSFDPTTNQFAHMAGIMIATPDGRLSRYLYGIQYPERDLRLALVEASDRKIGNLADQVLLFCYHYDPTQGKYGFAIMNAIRVLGSATVIALGVLIVTMVRSDRSGVNT